MKSFLRHFILGATLALSLGSPFAAFAQQPEPKADEKSAPPPAAPAADTVAPTPATPPTPPAAAGEPTPTPTPELRRIDTPAAPGATPAPERDANREDSRPRRRHSDNARISVGHDAHLEKGEQVDAVVAIFGSATSEGEVSDAVVSILGNTRVTGPVGDSAVAVAGSTYVNSKVGHEVVAVMGNVELGPDADVGGDVVAVGGRVTRDPKAVVRGNVQNVAIGPVFSADGLDWLVTWFQRCALYGRLLAIGPNLGWAWGVALSFLALYVIFALLFRGGVEKCVTTLETRPGSSIVASLLTVLLAPVLIILLMVTVVGVPFAIIGLLIATLFGKAVMLAWLGRRFTRFFGDGPLNHPAVSVLVGGIVVLGLYMIPVVGIIVFKLTKFLGLGVVVYTILLSARREKAVRVAAAQAAAVPPVATATSLPAAGIPLGVAAGVPVEPMGVVPEAPPVMAASIAANTLPRAGFWLRTGALVLDFILVGVIVGMLSEMLPRLHRPEFPQVALLALAIYGAVMWKLKGTTIGGIVCGLKVVRADGRQLDWATAVVRALGCFLSLIVVGLGFLWVIIDDEKQSWHDKIAGTVVVRVPKGLTLV